uniref:F-box domain-containing protein n=1 Tax=Mycena chlorophos TaxID=658473 RepID=A0ABQ0LJH5_MYCCL|nr:predicted protein [Mycena chlorophos]
MSTLVSWLLNHTSPPPFRLLSLPDELVLSILSFADSSALHQTALVSRLCFELATETLLRRNGIAFDDSDGGEGVVCRTSEALCALRLALALPSSSKRRRRQLPKTLDYVPTNEKPSSHDVKRISRILRHLHTGTRLTGVSLDFKTDILARPLGWRMSIVVPELLHALCGCNCASGDSQPQFAAFVVHDGIATYPVDRLRLWNPHEREAYTVRKLHDGAHSGPMYEMPTIRGITSLQAFYPACTSPSPLSSSSSSPHQCQWTVLTVNATTITKLILRLPLKPHEWESILSELTLPNLRVVEVLETVAIAPSTVVGFLNRHRLEAITFLPYASESEPSASHTEPAASLGGSRETLVQPALQRLRARAHFVEFALGLAHSASHDSDDSDEPHFEHSAVCSPNLKHVELWPSSRAVTCLPSESPSESCQAAAALRVLSSISSVAAELTSLTLHSFEHFRRAFTDSGTDAGGELWPVFLRVRDLTLTNLKCGLDPNSDSNVDDAQALANLLEMSFPALRKLVVTFRHSAWQSGIASVSVPESSWTKALSRWSWAGSRRRLGRDLPLQVGAEGNEETDLSLSKKDWVRILAARNPHIVEYVVDGEIVQG